MWCIVVHVMADRTENGLFETGVEDRRGNMDGTVQAIKNALGDKVDDVHVTIESHFNDDPFVRVMTGEFVEDAPDVPSALDNQLVEWGYEHQGEVGQAGNHIYHKQTGGE